MFPCRQENPKTPRQLKPSRLNQTILAVSDCRLTVSAVLSRRILDRRLKYSFNIKREPGFYPFFGRV